MRLFSFIFIFLLVLMTSAQCQHTVGRLYNKGNSFYNQGNYDEAIKACCEALRLDPNLASAWNNKGVAFYLLGRITQTYAALAKAKELGYTG